MTAAKNNLKHVIVIGAGGNIGSHLLPHLARMTQVGKLTLIDPDSYDLSNLSTQNITRRDVGRRKVTAQARKLSQINPALEVRSLPLPVESVPLGSLRSDLLLACLDSRRARLCVNRVALRLGMPWIDAGVEPGGWLARVNVYSSAHDGPCLECAWDNDDYRLLEQRYLCSGEDHPALFPSNSPSSLGALAASLQALEARKLLVDEGAPALADRQVLLDARYQRHFVTTLARRSDCVNRPHQSWQIKALNVSANTLRLADIFELWKRPNRGRKNDSTSKQATSLRVEAHRFGRRVCCPACGHCKENWRLLRANNSRDLRCPHCHRKLWPVGRDQARALTASLLSRRDLNRTLYSFGLRDRDVITLSNHSSEQHYEISAPELKEIGCYSA